MKKVCSSSQKVNMDGTCSNCLGKLVPSADKRSCISKECDKGSIRDRSGICVRCKTGTKISPDKSSCIVISCKYNERIVNN